MIRTFIIFYMLILAVPTASAGNRHKQHINNNRPFSTQSYLIAKADGYIIEEHYSGVARPIASISKLMVALLAAKQDMEEELNIPAKRFVQSGIPYKQETMTRKQLLTMALVKSDNFAAQILCENIINCIESMNNKAAELEMANTHFAEPTGLSKENVSTAADLLKLMMAAADDSMITNISSMPKADISTNRKIIKIRNTNPLTNVLDVILSKTGFTNPAGGCMIMAVNSPFGQRFLILLGSRNTRTRIPEMVILYNKSQL